MLIIYIQINISIILIILSIPIHINYSKVMLMIRIISNILIIQLRSSLQPAANKAHMWISISELLLVLTRLTFNHR